MSTGMSWLVAIGTVLSMAACFWLIVWTNRQRQSEAEITESESHVWDGDVRELNNPLPMWWLYLFVLTLLFSLGYLVVFPGLVVVDGASGWSQIDQYEAQMAAAEERYGPIFDRYGSMDYDELVTNSDALEIGRSLFANYCAQCHGSAARGAVGFPNLTDDAWSWGGTPQNIEFAILNGRTGIMPALGAALTNDVDNMVAYVRAMPDGIDTGNPAHSKYVTFCSACHGPEGKGNPALGAPDLTDDIWLYGSTADAVRQSITEGRNGVMPAHRSLIGEDRARILAAYVYSLSGNRTAAD